MIPGVLPVGLQGCITKSLSLREEYVQRVFKNRVQSKIFGHKRQNVKICFKKLCNKKSHE
jgi:hypothetical protein